MTIFGSLGAEGLKLSLSPRFSPHLYRPPSFEKTADWCILKFEFKTDSEITTNVKGLYMMQKCQPGSGITT